MVRYEVGLTDGFTVGVGLHQGSALSPLLFAVEVDTLKDEVRLESSWIIVFVDDVVICSENSELEEANW